MDGTFGSYAEFPILRRIDCILAESPESEHASGKTGKILQRFHGMLKTVIAGTNETKAHHMRILKDHFIGVIDQAFPNNIALQTHLKNYITAKFRRSLEKEIPIISEPAS